MAAQHQLIRTRIHRPIEVTQIIAGLVRTMIVELQRGSGPAPQASAQAAATTRIHTKPQASGGSSDSGFIPGRHANYARALRSPASATTRRVTSVMRRACKAMIANMISGKANSTPPNPVMLSEGSSTA